MNRYELLEIFVFHDINEGKLIKILARFDIFDFLSVGKKKIILASKLFLAGKQRAIDLRVGVDFMFVKDTISLLFLNSLVAGQISRSDIAQVVCIVITVAGDCLLDSVVNIFLAVLKKGERLFVFDF